jgi:ATP-dependent DNA helicase RecG
MIIKYLQQYPNASRHDIDTLLLDKLSDVLSENQKRIKVKNLLAAMSHDRLIRNAGSRRFPRWVLN